MLTEVGSESYEYYVDPTLTTTSMDRSFQLFQRDSGLQQSKPHSWRHRCRNPGLHT